MEFKGTKGEWFNDGLTIMNKQTRRIIGGCHLMTFEHDRRGKLLPDTIGIANAKIIASAPEMFELLNKIYDKVECGAYGYDIEQLLTKITQ
jgi:hypothetical protein